MSGAFDDHCIRCGSDTCPGRDDLLDCTARIGFRYAREEARELLAAATRPPEPAKPADPLTEAKIAHALAAARANTAFMNRLAERIENDRDLLDRLAGDRSPAARWRCVDETCANVLEHALGGHDCLGSK